MKDITNYFKITDYLATSGQPNREQFQKIALDGYQVVINLALPSSSNALADEGSIVTELKMIYLHIPVSWNNPHLQDLQLFFKVMEMFKNSKVWVHCALNMRVSCFLYLYQKHILKLPPEQANYPMREIWQPEGVWQQLIIEAETAFN